MPTFTMKQHTCFHVESNDGTRNRAGTFEFCPDVVGGMVRGPGKEEESNNLKLSYTPMPGPAVSVPKDLHNDQHSHLCLRKIRQAIT